MEQLEKEKQKLKWKWYKFISIFTFQIVFNFFGVLSFEYLAKKTGVEKSEIFISSLVITSILSHVINALFIWYGYNSWEKLSEKLVKQKELETKQNIQKQIEEVKKELLETKTELLLTQNKLREEQEKNRKENLEKGS